MTRDADKFIVRLPAGMRDVIKKTAAENRRSMNAEVVFQLERVFGQTKSEAAEQSSEAA